MFVRRGAALAGATLLGGYAYDTFEGGAKINRSTRAVYVALATFVEYKFVLGNSNDSLSQIHKRVAERWLWCVRQNGGLYSKLAQGIASMNHVLPPEYLDTLSVIQDKAPVVGHHEVEQVLKEEFGKSSAELFATFELDAVASASVAQVHRATLKDGTKVAVKIQKPEIAKQIDADLFMYRVLGYFLEKAFSLPIMWSIPYTCGQLRQETDFRIESENGKLAMAKTEPDLKHCVTIPKIYDDFSSKRVLTCEWIDGVKVTDLKAIKQLGLDPVEVMTIVTRFFSHQLFVSGHLHADPHPGNIMVRLRPGTEKLTKKHVDVVVLDHGLYCREPEAFRLSYAKLWRSIIIGDTEAVKKVAESWGIKDHELFASFQLFRPYKGGSMKAPVTSTNASRKDLLELQASVKERVVKMLSDTALTPPELSLVGRHLNLIRSLNKALNSPVNRPRIMAVYANRGLHKNESHQWLTDARFNLSIFGIELMYQLAELWRNIKQRLTGKDPGGFEDMLEKQLTQNVEQQLGFKLSPPANGDMSIG